MKQSKGFSLVETLVTILVVSCLSAIGGLIYIEYLESAKHSTLTQTVRNVETEVKLEVDHIFRGGTSSTPSVETGEAITGEITCDEYVRSLAQNTATFATLMMARRWSRCGTDGAPSRSGERSGSPVTRSTKKQL